MGIKLIAAAVLLAASTANAGFITGNKLMSYLESNDSIENGLGLGFIAGVHDAGDGVKFCTPANTNIKQLRDMVLDILRKVPSERHNSADLYVEAAFANQWPCEKKGRSL
jgi:hypothetical protein